MKRLLILLATLGLLISTAASALTPGEQVQVRNFYTTAEDALAELANPTTELTDHDWELINAGRLIMVPPGASLIGEAKEMLAERAGVRLQGSELTLQVWRLEIMGRSVYVLGVDRAQKIKGVDA